MYLCVFQDDSQVSGTLASVGLDGFVCSELKEL